MRLKSMLLRYGEADIDRRQQHENVRLKQRNENVQSNKYRRDQDGYDLSEDALEDIAHQHIRVKTDAERKQAADVANHLDGKHQHGDRQHGAREVLQIADDAVLPHTMEVVIEES